MGLVVKTEPGFLAQMAPNGLHVFPEKDLWDHFSLSCECRPTTELKGGLPIYTHHRFDGADLVEAVERGEAIA